MPSRGIVIGVAASALVVLGGCSGPASSPQAARPVASTSPAAPSPAAPAPTKKAAPVVAKKIVVPAAVRGTHGRTAVLPATHTSTFSLLGVTWDRGADDGSVTVEVKVRTTKGWSGWEHLDVDDEAAEGGRSGTEPWWVDDADQVSARVTTASGAAASNVRVVTIAPGVDGPPAAVTAPAVYTDDIGSQTVTAADGTPYYTAMPTIISRAAWHAKAQTKSNSCNDPTHGYPEYGATLKGVLLHHTAGSNSYSKSQSASIVRAIQAYHMKGRGWCDIAYNFLVDKYGQIFKGRDGDSNRAVRGSHAGNSAVNEETMGVSLLGNLDKVKPSTAMKNATVKLMGWRMGTTYLPAKGSYHLGGKVLNRIAGHRNVVPTACPGKYGYAWLSANGGLRDRVAKYISHYASGIKAAAAKLPAATKGVVVVGEVGGSTWRRTIFSKLDFYWLKSAGAYYVSGAVRTTYNSYGGSSGKLGYPLSNLSVPGDDGSSVQQFQHGTITVTPGSPPVITLGEPTTPPPSPSPAAPVAPTSTDSAPA
ncbi:MAG: hypothetical protein JWR83_1474 [Aeromicrobium sp.]|nr:hypothetical protein [Aeromicrobium sp.]